MNKLQSYHWCTKYSAELETQETDNKQVNYLTDCRIAEPTDIPSVLLL